MITAADVRFTPKRWKVASPTKRRLTRTADRSMRIIRTRIQKEGRDANGTRLHPLKSGQSGLPVRGGGQGKGTWAFFSADDKRFSTPPLVWRWPAQYDASGKAIRGFENDFKADEEVTRQLTDMLTILDQMGATDEAKADLAKKVSRHGKKTARAKKKAGKAKRWKVHEAGYADLKKTMGKTGKRDGELTGTMWANFYASIKIKKGSVDMLLSFAKNDPNIPKSKMVVNGKVRKRGFRNRDKARLMQFQRGDSQGRQMFELIGLSDAELALVRDDILDGVSIFGDRGGA